jgi:hypothetical protein
VGEQKGRKVELRRSRGCLSPWRRYGARIRGEAGQGVCIRKRHVRSDAAPLLISGPSLTLDWYPLTGAAGSSRHPRRREKLDGGKWSSRSSPKTYKGLSESSHTFRVYAIDKTGQHDPTPAKRTWRSAESRVVDLVALEDPSVAADLAGSVSPEDTDDVSSPRAQKQTED